MRRRLASWLDAHLRANLGPLLAARDATLSGAARGLMFVLAEGLGTVPRRQVAAQLEALAPDDRRVLNGLGVTLGRLTVFMPAILRPEALRLRARRKLGQGHRETTPIDALGPAPLAASPPREAALPLDVTERGQDRGHLARRAAQHRRELGRDRERSLAREA